MFLLRQIGLSTVTLLAPISALLGPARANGQEANQPASVSAEDEIAREHDMIDNSPAKCRRDAERNSAIVVCADPSRRDRMRLPFRDESDNVPWVRDGVPHAPDVFGIHHGDGGVAASGCFVPPCPPPPVYYIDLKAIPEAPLGSDADRIAKGEAPSR